MNFTRRESFAALLAPLVAPLVSKSSPLPAPVTLNDLDITVHCANPDFAEFFGDALYEKLVEKG